MADTSQGEGWWVAADGKWYPPESAPGGETPASARPSPATAPHGSTSAAAQNNPGGLVSFIGWFVVIAGLAVIIATLTELSSAENEFLELNLADYLMAMSPGFTVVGIGAAAAALGGLLNRST